MDPKFSDNEKAEAEIKSKNFFDIFGYEYQTKHLQNFYVFIFVLAYIKTESNPKIKYF